MRLIFIISFILVLLPSVAAHEVLMSNSRIQIENNSLFVRTEIGNSLNITNEQDYFEQYFIVRNNGYLCRTDFRESFVVDDIYSFFYVAQCPEKIDLLNITDNLFYDFYPEYHPQMKHSLHITDGKKSADVIVSKKDQPVVPELKKEKNKFISSLVLFIPVGVEHILLGYDHVLFLLALLLVVRRLRDLFYTVTSFTIAHSLTLGLAASGFLVITSSIVEPIIAFSIAYMAFENIYPRKASAKRLWLLTFGFGLIHGLGFASALQNISIPENGFLLSVLSFNVGVEAGQLIIVLLIFPLLWYFREHKWYKSVVRVISIIILFIGLSWFIERLLSSLYMLRSRFILFSIGG